MAKPIKHNPVVDTQELLSRKLEAAPLEHAEALLSLYEVLQQVHEGGILEILRGVFGSGEQLTNQMTHLATQPEAIRGIRNLIIMTKLFGSLDPDMLNSIALSLPAHDPEIKEQSTPPSLFAILRKMMKPDSRRTLALTASLLENIGKSLDPNKQVPTEHEY